jgi:uncharacterized protein (TIGR03067 family)
MFTRNLLAILVSLVAVGASVGRGQDDAQELQKLQGEWVFKGVESTMTYTIKGNEYTFTRPDGKISKVAFKIDATKDPKTFDRTAESGNVRLGIYKIEGDTLTICSNISSDSKLRPADFSSKPGERSMTAWTRAKK